MTGQPNIPRAAAGDPAADGPPLSAEEAQAEALNVTDTQAWPGTGGEPAGAGAPAATPGEDVDSAEEAQAEQAPPEEPDYKDLYLRASADMDNLRKRARRDVGLAQDRGIAKLAKELLPAIDNLERAMQAAMAAGESSQDVTQGLRLVQAELVAALGRAGITVEDPKGQPFDPHRHEALAQAPTEGVEAGIVVEAYQPGYVLGETVLRAARVVVSS